MDENKELQGVEQDTPAEILSNSDTPTEILSEETTQVAEEEISTENTELENEAPVEVEAEAIETVDTNSVFDENITPEATPSSKKKILQTSVLVSLIIVLAAALGFGIFAVFFNSSIVGSWVLNIETSATNDEAGSQVSENYFIFGKDGMLAVPNGTTKNLVPYTLDEGKDSPTVTFSEATYKYKVSGNSITGRRLELTIDGYDEVLSFSEKTYVAPKMEPDKSFTPKDELCGKWEYKGEGYNYDYTLEFNNDGSGVYTQSYGDYSFIIDAVYTYDDEAITMTYNVGEDTEMPLPYELKDGKLVLMGTLEFTKVTE